MPAARVLFLPDVLPVVLLVVLPLEPGRWAGKKKAAAQETGTATSRRELVQKKEEKLGRLKEYEKMYEQGKIPLKALEKQREKCRILEAQEGAE